MKLFRKALSLILAMAMVLSLAACGGNSSTSTSGTATAGASTETESASNYRVAMITDSGDITDQSFNQTTYESCKNFCETNNVDFSYYKPSDDNTDARVEMVDAAISDGYNVIVMPGYLFSGAIVERSSMYPDVKFIALDLSDGNILEAALGDQYDYNPANWDVSEYYNTENTYCAIYQEELPGYMAGYAAVKMGYKNLGFLGGMAVPAVIRFGYGFIQGADAAATEMGIADEVSLNYAYGGIFSGSTEITAAMDTWYSGGTEIVFACGGGIYTSACEAAAKVNGKLIGVDSDQSFNIDADYGEGMTVTSAMKGLSATVNTVLDSIIISGTWESDFAGKIDNLGLVSADDTSLNYVGLPEETTQWNDSFTVDDYKALVKSMIDGTLSVSNDTSAVPQTSIKLNVREGTIK